jgi:hypothetical protein
MGGVVADFGADRGRLAEFGQQRQLVVHFRPAHTDRYTLQTPKVTGLLFFLRTLSVAFIRPDGHAPRMFKSIDHLGDGIAKALEKKKSFTVYDNDLSKLWPPSRHTRQKQIEAIRKFAKEHGWEVKIRDQGLIATFKKASPQPAGVR